MGVSQDLIVLKLTVHAMVGMGFDSTLIHKLSIWIQIQFNIDYFGYISGTLHAKFSQGNKISQLML